jgi:organic hydroperoxide reductase OsmC/OhrA
LNYTVEVVWHRGDRSFVDNRYSREHRWIFDGGVTVAASSSPHVVPIPYSEPEAVDPEEAFVASLSSCHMLWFLSLAAKAGFQVDLYVDQPVGVMAKNTEGKDAMTKVTLRPRIGFSGERRPTPGDIDALHHQAHDECFIANSVKTDVVVEPVY